MKANSRLIKITSPQSVKAIDEEDDFVNNFLNPNEPLFSVLRPSKHPSKQRIAYLWKRTRILIKTIARLIRLWRNIHLYGGSRNHLRVENNYARTESSESYKGDARTSYLIYPNTLFAKLWGVFMFVLLLYTAVVLPFRISFVEESSTVWLRIETIEDFMFFCDILVNFNSAYLDDAMRLVHSRKAIVLNYLKSWFIFDLVACLPLNLIFPNSQSYNKIIRLTRISRLYKLLRIFKLFKLVRVLRSVALVEKFSEALKMSKGIMRLMKFILIVFLVIHVNGCLWYFIAKIDDLNSESWISRYYLADFSTTDLYIASIYFVIQTIATIGFGDIVPFTIYEKFYTLLLLLIGVGFYSYIVGNLSNIVKIIDTDQTKVKTMLLSLREFAKATKLPVALYEKIKRHIETFNASTVNSFDKMNLIKELPTSLKKEVQVHMHKKIVEKILFFQDKDSQFITRVVGKLKNMELSNGETVYEHGDCAEEIYFISKGRVTMKSDKGLVFKNYMQGSYFGELELLSNTSRKATVQIASSKATILIMSKRDFLAVLLDFPDVYLEVKTTARVREQKFNEANRDMLNSMLSAKLEINKAKTSNDQIKSRQAPKQTISRQGWKHFLKHSLGIEPSTEAPLTIGPSVWDRYAEFREAGEEATEYHRFISKDSIKELFDRAGNTYAASRHADHSALPMKSFAGADLRLRHRPNHFQTIEFEKFCSHSVSFDHSREENNSIGRILDDLKENELAAEDKYIKLIGLLETVHTQQIAIKAKLANFFVHSIS